MVSADRCANSRPTPLKASVINLIMNVYPETKHISTGRNFCGIIRVFVCENTSTGIIWLPGESSKSETSEESWLSHPTSLCISSTLYWILIRECSQYQAAILSKQMMDGAPTGLSLSSFSCLSGSSRYEQMNYIWTISCNWLSFIYFLSLSIYCPFAFLGYFLLICFVYLTLFTSPVIKAVLFGCLCIQNDKISTDIRTAKGLPFLTFCPRFIFLSRICFSLLHVGSQKAHRLWWFSIKNNS